MCTAYKDASFEPKNGLPTSSPEIAEVVDEVQGGANVRSASGDAGQSREENCGDRRVKSVPPKQRLDMVERIHPKYWKHLTPQPVKKVYIPKPGKDERRPLGIPVMVDRDIKPLSNSHWNLNGRVSSRPIAMAFAQDVPVDDYLKPSTSSFITRPSMSWMLT